MTSGSALSLDEILDRAADIFQELAVDSLDDALIALFQDQFEERGALCGTLPDADWQEYLDSPLDSEAQVEIIIGLVNQQGQFETVFARLLLSRDPDDQRCHIRWSS